MVFTACRVSKCYQGHMTWSLEVKYWKTKPKSGTIYTEKHRPVPCAASHSLGPNFKRTNWYAGKENANSRQWPRALYTVHGLSHGCSQVCLRISLSDCKIGEVTFRSAFSRTNISRTYYLVFFYFFVKHVNVHHHGNRQKGKECPDMKVEPVQLTYIYGPSFNSPSPR